jgi:transketolase
MPIAAGIALCGRVLDRLPYRVSALCGDSEMAEGSIWEAVEHTGAHRLGNLTVLVDVNCFGQRGEPCTAGIWRPMSPNPAAPEKI